YVVAVHHQGRDILKLAGLRLVSCNCRLNSDNGHYLVGPGLRYGKAEAAGLTMKQENAGAYLVDQRDIGGNDRFVRGGPPRHNLLGEIVVGRDRELAASIHFHLRGIGIPRTCPLANAETFERICLGQEIWLAVPYIRRGEAGAAAFDGVGIINVPALADEDVEPAFPTVGRALISDAREAAAVPH